MMVICDDGVIVIVIIEHDGRRGLGHSNAPVVMEHDNNITEEYTAIALNIQHNFLCKLFTSRTV